MMVRMEAVTYTPQEMHIPQITVAVRMMLARKEAGLDQAQLADVIGIATRSVQNYEHGNTTPKRPVLLAWAMATGVPLYWLMEGDIEPPTCPVCDEHAEEHSGMTCFLCSAQVSTPDSETQPEPERAHLHLVPTPC